ncbi:MAG TPA: M20/M25/M40 family metallo-hydrolase, partial [Vicinamibacterales bacterium]|nr:M20/M25/M40 family metallo-hydrolase [Vicinamibacterales bacterium]
MSKRTIAIGALAGAVWLAPLGAAERVNADINAKIRQEEAAHSQVMRTLHYLTDVYGPRVTGSPSLKTAGEWAIKTMESWGMTNGHLEPWDFGHPGWVNERFTAHADLSAFLNGAKDKVNGKIVLVGKHIVVPVNFNPPAKRRDDEQVRQQYDPNNPDGGRGGRGGPGGRGGRGSQAPPPMTARQIDEQVDAFLVAGGAKVRINDAGREHGQIIAFNNRTYDLAKAVPTVVMRNEDYGRISRVLADGTPVELEFNIVNKVYPEGRTAYNTIAEIPGTDKKNEIVMLGGHLDSWHSATGATDNAIGCAMMMEAARILKAIGVAPRRTIRVALWSGEEEGLLGSQAYVKDHFGSFESQKPEFKTLDAYLNIDSGTGRPRGASIFGPAPAASIVRDVLAPFQDLKV